MNEQQDRSAQDKDGDEATAEETFEESVAEIEVDSEIAEDSAQDLSQLLEQARAKADEHYAQLMRAHAELENLKSGTRAIWRMPTSSRSTSSSPNCSASGTAWNWATVPRMDESADVNKLREGTELTLKMLGDAMAKFGVEQIDPLDQPFNPELHQAMSMQPRADVPPNTVVAVVQKGYTLNGRLVRPAMVMVSQAAGPA